MYKRLVGFLWEPTSLFAYLVLAIHMSLQLTGRKYSHSDKGQFASFDCGPRDYEREISDWIKDEYPDCVTDDLAAGKVDSVHIYELGKKGSSKIIGYGALATDRWLLDLGSPAILLINMIAMLGLDKDYHGMPAGVPPEERYSTAILHDLIAKAKKRTDRFPAIGLYVHPQNAKAKSVYERNGFMIAPGIEWYNERLNANYAGMILLF
jgi:hypothetical protein